LAGLEYHPGRREARMGTEKKGGTAPLNPVKGRPGVFVYDGDKPSSATTAEVYREVFQRSVQKGSEKSPESSPKKDS